MNVARLVAKEIRYRKLNFALAALGVVVAVGALVAMVTLLRAYGEGSESLAEAREAAARERVNALQDDYRKITLTLGYNVLILPASQDLGRFWAEGYATETMPEDYVQRLARSRIMTVRHLLPSLQRKMVWPEKEVPIVLVGTRGEVPAPHRDPKKPLRVAVPPGGMVVGALLAEQLGLEPGEEIVLLGRPFTVTRIHDPRGNEDDVTVWIDLATAQELFDASGRINAILALSCMCAQSNLPAIRDEVARILPETQVLELSTRAAARRAARLRAATHADESLAAEEQGRLEMRRERAALAAWVVPLVVVTCTVWVGMLAFSNVRQRRGEIGILRALGVRGRQVFAVFLAKSLAIGAIGAVVGWAAGFALGAAWGSMEAAGEAGVDATGLFSGPLLAAALVLAPLLSAAAGLVPAMFAASQDPAVVLREE